MVGADAIGDVQVVPEGMPPADPPAILDPSHAASDDFAAVFARATSTDPDQLDRVALPGVQVKVSAALISTPVGTAAGPAILKLNPEGYPHLVENEHFFLSMARGCGLPVPAHRLLHDRARRLGLLVERFDRELDPSGSLRRLAQEDGCAAYDLLSTQPYLRWQDPGVRSALMTVRPSGCASSSLAGGESWRGIPAEGVAFDARR